MKIRYYTPKIEMIASLEGEKMMPEDLVVFGAHATIKREDLKELFKRALEEDRLDDYRKRILKTTLESGHLSVLDQAVFSFNIRNIPRLSTLFLVQPLYLSHLQQSMRIVEPYGLYIPEKLKKFNKILDEMTKAIELYYKMVDDGIPKEDARYVIPLYTVTNILTVGNARELTYLYLLSRDKWIPNITKDVVNKMIREAEKRAPNLFKKWGENYNIFRYYPSPNLFRKPGDDIDSFINSLRRLRSGTMIYSYSIGYKASEDDIIDLYKNGNTSVLQLLRNNTYNILTKMSIAALHQALRQRTWNHITESIFKALERLEYVVPPSIKNSIYREKYEDMVLKLYKGYHRLLKSEVDPNIAIGVISHSHTINDLMKIDGWNILISFPIRRCLKAQWEIRYISGEMASEVKKIDPILSKYSLPQCITIGKCPEKHPCEYIDHFLKIGPYVM